MAREPVRQAGEKGLGRLGDGRRRSVRRADDDRHVGQKPHQDVPLVRAGETQPRRHVNPVGASRAHRLRTQPDGPRRQVVVDQDEAFRFPPARRRAFHAGNLLARAHIRDEAGGPHAHRRGQFAIGPGRFARRGALGEVDMAPLPDRFRLRLQKRRGRRLAPLRQIRQIGDRDERAALRDPLPKSRIRLRERGVHAGGDNHPHPLEMFLVQLFLEQDLDRQARRQQGHRRLARIIAVGPSQGARQTQGRLGIQKRDARRHAPVPRREKIVDRRDVVRRVLDALERLRRTRQRIQGAVRKVLRLAAHAVGALPDGIPSRRTVHLEIIGPVQAARIFQEDPVAVRRARVAHVGFPVHEGTLPGDSQGDEHVERVPAARGRHHDVRRLVGQKRIDLVERIAERLEAGARFGVDFPQRRLPLPDGARKRPLVEFHRLDFRRGGRSSGRKFGEFLREGLACLGRRIFVGRFVEEFIDERPHAIGQQFSRAALEHLPVEPPPFFRQDGVRHEMAIPGRKRVRRRQPPGFRPQRAVRPVRTGEIDIDGQSVVVVPGRDPRPVHLAVRLPERLLRTVLAHPRRRRFAAGRVEAEPVELGARRRLGVDPLRTRRNLHPGRKIRIRVRRGGPVDEVGDQIDGLAVILETPVRGDLEACPGREGLPIAATAKRREQKEQPKRQALPG